MRINATARYVLYACVVGLCTVALPATARAATITIQATNTADVNNCFPFGCPSQFGSEMGFIYQNIPAFTLAPGDILAFDVAEPNDVPLAFNIALAQTTVNGGTTANAAGFATVVSGTPTNVFGDSIVGNYDLQYVVSSPFTFAGGGLIIRFDYTGAAFDGYNTAQYNLVGAFSASDPSGYFVGRYYNETASTTYDTAHVGNFRITNSVPAPEPNTLLLLGTALLGAGVKRWRQR